MKIAACQPPEIRGDFAKSLDYIEHFTQMAQARGADLICFPECFLGGYFQDQGPATKHAIQLSSAAFQHLAAQLAHFKPVIVVGLNESGNGKLFNSVIILEHGNLVGRYAKQHLLKSEDFFTAGNRQPVFKVRDLSFGVNICFDTQFSNAASQMVTSGADVILCPSNNMLPTPTAEQYKDLHNECRSQRALEHKCWHISSDVTGQREGHAAYGPTAAINPQGEIVDQVPLGEEGIIIVTI